MSPMDVGIFKVAIFLAEWIVVFCIIYPIVCCFMRRTDENKKHEKKEAEK